LEGKALVEKGAMEIADVREGKKYFAGEKCPVFCTGLRNFVEIRSHASI
jgi:hypothetical protein